MNPTFNLHNCPIFLGPLAESFPAWLHAQNYSQVFVITDEHTYQDCLPYLAASGLPKYETSDGQSPTLASGIIVPASEQFKILATCEKIWQAMLADQLDRRALVINLGGGVIGDMGGFCAATWKRGVDFVQIPTTLLAMTDAAIGGKTGIDFHGIKNTIGVFQQPRAVFVDPFFLKTLPNRELRSGYAEVAKHALIGNPELQKHLAGHLALANDAPEFWLDILHQSIAVKVRVVEEDPLEQNLRMILNFGHSIGHALESLFLETKEPLTHGEAIYIGMICEAYAVGNEALCAHVLALGQTVYPHLNIPETAFPGLWRRLLQDKKNTSGTVRMSVPDAMPFSLRMVELTPSELERSLAFYNTLGFRGKDAGS